LYLNANTGKQRKEILKVQEEKQIACNETVPTFNSKSQRQKVVVKCIPHNERKQLSI
jgi:hypothetical protein